MAAARKVSAAHSSTVLPSERKTCASFADGRGLAGAVYADHQNHFRRAIDFLDRLFIGRGQNREHFFFEQPLQFADIS